MTRWYKGVVVNLIQGPDGTFHMGVQSRHGNEPIVTLTAGGSLQGKISTARAIGDAWAFHINERCEVLEMLGPSFVDESMPGVDECQWYANLAVDGDEGDEGDVCDYFDACVEDDDGNWLID